MTPVGVSGFRNMTALSSSGISRPFDAERDGFVRVEVRVARSGAAPGRQQGDQIREVHFAALVEVAITDEGRRFPRTDVDGGDPVTIAIFEAAFAADVDERRAGNGGVQAGIDTG